QLEAVYGGDLSCAVISQYLTEASDRAAGGAELITVQGIQRRIGIVQGILKRAERAYARGSIVLIMAKRIELHQAQRHAVFIVRPGLDCQVVGAAAVPQVKEIDVLE